MQTNSLRSEYNVSSILDADKCIGLIIIDERTGSHSHEMSTLVGILNLMNRSRHFYEQAGHAPFYEQGHTPVRVFFRNTVIFRFEIFLCHI